MEPLLIIFFCSLPAWLIAGIYAASWFDVPGKVHSTIDNITKDMTGDVN